MKIDFQFLTSNDFIYFGQRNAFIVAKELNQTLMDIITDPTPPGATFELICWAKSDMIACPEIYLSVETSCLIGI